MRDAYVQRLQEEGATLRRNTKVERILSAGDKDRLDILVGRKLVFDGGRVAATRRLDNSCRGCPEVALSPSFSILDSMYGSKG